MQIEKTEKIEALVTKIAALQSRVHHIFEETAESNGIDLRDLKIYFGPGDPRGETIERLNKAYSILGKLCYEQIKNSIFQDAP